MRVIFDDQSALYGKILEKEEAVKVYIEKLKEGNTVVMTNQNNENADLIKVEIGNLLPGKSVKIIFSYIDKLNV